MFRNIKQTFTHNLLNIPGWRTKKKIVVIASDDWGSIRMPSKEVYNQLLKEGYRPDNDPYLKYDSLANEDDLSALFDVLSSVKDKNGNHAVLTANCVVANPDFKRIKESEFSQYYYEPFTETLKHYPQHQHSFKLWKEGMEQGLFHPQFHGREHLNVAQWMKGLQNGDKLLHKAFEHEMISISSLPGILRFGYMEAFDCFNKIEEDGQRNIVTEGLDLFEKTFGFKSKSFIAPCYTWPCSLEKELHENGVQTIQGLVYQSVPKLNGSLHTYCRKKHFMGTKNALGQTYLVRNAFFEPSQYGVNAESIECLRRINIAFKWNKPAIISAHRLNFIGNIDSKNRSRNLENFKLLLHTVTKVWPDVEFMTSDQLGHIMKSES